MPFVLRFLRSVKYNNEEALKQIIYYFEWRSTKFPLCLNDKLVEIIVTSLKYPQNTGFIYVHGRDKGYRPVLVIQPGRILGYVRNVVSSQDDIAEKIADVCIFTFEFLIHYMFVPGKVENWATLIDLQKISITEIPRSVYLSTPVGYKKHD